MASVISRAQRAKVVRKDVTLQQILDMVVAISSIRGEPRYLKPILRTALDGLHPPTDKRDPIDRDKSIRDPS